MAESIGLIALLGVLQVGIVFVAVKYFGPLPRQSLKRLAAGFVTVVSVPVIILTQVIIEARLRRVYSSKLANAVGIVDGAISLCLILYFTYRRER
jgi:hypothetical protein